MKIVSVVAALFFAAVAFGQTPATCSADTGARILSIQNLASGSTTLSPGTLAKVLWCDLEFPAPTTPVYSALVNGQQALVIFPDLSTALQTTAVSSVAYRGYPGFTPREAEIYLNSNQPLPHNPVVQIARTGGQVASAEIQADSYSPGIFTMNRRPNGPAIARNNVDYIGGNNLVYAGDTISIYATGLGATSPIPPNATMVTPEVYVGKQQALVTGSKTLPLAGALGFPPPIGMYEVTFVVPPIDPSADTQPIFIRIGGIKSNVATLAVRP